MTRLKDWAPALFGFLSILSIVAVSRPAWAGKPTPPPPPPLPAARYWIALFPGGFMNDVNNKGQVVGYEWGTSKGFVYDAADQSYRYLDDVVGAPEGTIRSGVGINDNGTVTGALRNSGWERMGFVIDDVNSIAPNLTLLQAPPNTPPAAEGGGYSGTKINASGTVFGRYGDYDMYGDLWMCVWRPEGEGYGAPVDLGLPPVEEFFLNDSETIVGRTNTDIVFRRTPDGSVEVLPEGIWLVRGLNNANVLCGNMWIGNTDSAIRYGTTLEWSAAGSAWDINNQGHVLFQRTEKVSRKYKLNSYLYQNGPVYKLADLIHPNDPNKSLFVSSHQDARLMNDANDTGLGQIAGNLRVGDDMNNPTAMYGFILTPVLFQ